VRHGGARFADGNGGVRGGIACAGGAGSFGGQMNQDEVKKMLLDIERAAMDFFVVFTGKKSKKVNGLYKYDTFEILLHNKNFSTDGELIYTAIHEYTHHLEHERILEQNGGREPAVQTRFHNTDFWARFHGLLETAEKKNYYSLNSESSPELSALTQAIQKIVRENGEAARELGTLLIKAQKICEKENVRYEDYIDRVLRLPRAAAKTLAKISEYQVDPALGYENMKFVASIPSGEKRRTAEAQFLDGKSPDMVREEAKKEAKKNDPKGRLEQEKRRIERTIQTLSARLKQVEENLSLLNRPNQ
jgi:hypothetical protein